MVEAFIVLMALLPVSQDPELVAAKVGALPEADGKADDTAWAKAKELVVKVAPPAELDDPKKEVRLKAVHDGDSICILMIWSDDDENALHEPFRWNAASKAYVADAETVEDAASLSFPLEGKFDPDMLAGVESVWDLWEFQGARTRHGWAKDKAHHYVKGRRPEAIRGAKFRSFRSRDESKIFICRPEDEGTSVTKEASAPAEYKGDVVAHYESQAPSGSAADVRAGGVWAKGTWTVEFKRKLVTGHADDAPFDPAKTIPFAVATFDGVEGSDHEVSRGLVLRFE